MAPFFSDFVRLRWQSAKSGKDTQCWALVDVFHDLPRHRGEAGRLDIPKVHLSTLSKNGCNVPLFQSSGTSAAFHDLWQVD